MTVRNFQPKVNDLRQALESAKQGVRSLEGKGRAFSDSINRAYTAMLSPPQDPSKWEGVMPASYVTVKTSFNNTKGVLNTNLSEGERFKRAGAKA